MKKKDLLIPVAMLALGAGIGFWTRDRQAPAASADARGDLATAATRVEAPVADAATDAPAGEPASTVKPAGFEMIAQVAPGFAAAPLPPLDAKIADIYDALKERAQHGDGKAACRLAIELQQCVWREAIIQDLDRATRRMENRPAPQTADPRQAEWESRMLDMAQRQVDYASALDARCKGLSDAQVAAHVDWWRTAALSGHVPSLLHYAKGDAFRLNATLDNLERLGTYRNDAERLMRAAAAAGSPEALQQLLLAYAPERSPRGTLLQQAITPDPVEAQAILRLMQERGIALPRSEMGRRGEAMEPPASLSRLDAAAQARADRRLAELRSAWPQTDAATDTRQPPWEQEDARRKACDQDRFATLR
ncbi:MAG TPA: hypothetical protein PLB00_12780 [Pseudomonadota bacterium]|nr:hypothetical protein [Pseudomonadota bacterium]